MPRLGPRDRGFARDPDGRLVELVTVSLKDRAGIPLADDFEKFLQVLLTGSQRRQTFWGVHV